MGQSLLRYGRLKQYVLRTSWSIWWRWDFISSRKCERSKFLHGIPSSLAITKLSTNTVLTTSNTLKLNDINKLWRLIATTLQLVTIPAVVWITVELIDQLFLGLDNDWSTITVITTIELTNVHSIRLSTDEEWFERVKEVNKGNSIRYE